MTSNFALQRAIRFALIAGTTSAAATVAPSARAQDTDTGQLQEVVITGTAESDSAAAIERVEILTEGASALYDSDAIAGVAPTAIKDVAFPLICAQAATAVHNIEPSRSCTAIEFQ